MNSEYGKGTEFVFELPVKPIVKDTPSLKETGKAEMGKIEKISIEFSG